MKPVVSAGLTPVGPLLQAFFIDYLYGQKRASAQTVESYRDIFRLLLRFLQQTTGKAPSALHTLDLDAPVILRFLERQRNNQPLTFSSSPEANRERSEIAQFRE